MCIYIYIYGTSHKWPLIVFAHSAHTSLCQNARSLAQSQAVGFEVWPWRLWAVKCISLGLQSATHHPYIWEARIFHAIGASIFWDSDVWMDLHICWISLPWMVPESMHALLCYSVDLGEMRGNPADGWCRMARCPASWKRSSALVPCLDRAPGCGP